MFNWIWQNKEWLFSGIGVVIVVGGVGLFYRRIFPRRIAPNNSIAEFPPAASLPSQVLTISPQVALPIPHTTTPTFTKPNPVEIIKQINSVPPYQQQHAKLSYKGLSVCWEAAFRDVWTPAQVKGDKVNRCTVVLRYENKSEYENERIHCRDVDFDAYPMLKIAHRGHRVIVRAL